MLGGQGENIMANTKDQETEHHSGNILGVFLGMLIGGLAGAVAMLLLAPQSGEDTRMQIQAKGIELRDRTAGMLDEAMAEVRLDRNKIATGGRQKAHELLQHGQALVVEQLDRVSEAAQAGKKAIQSS
jgi:gas vesicle protein